jgi:hypothetical protein
MGLERDPLSLVSTADELLGRKSSGSGLDPSRWRSLGRSRTGIVDRMIQGDGI